MDALTVLRPSEDAEAAGQGLDAGEAVLTPLLGSLSQRSPGVVVQAPEEGRQGPPRVRLAF
ncbi:hypothetical protein IQ216_11865 [Cyanobium sp. LEGE 06143]|uniref:hypothetical protein n=1 Tax=Cyanobium sp. LEGE 06143 TaxID=945727 RepID=UPI001882D8E7|nr:hypothetical protein [Cyanobium sp. LEGE 06143]MBE9173737.1 hypothetical protein [Cyanobium sp. LEGE 06143]